MAVLVTGGAGFIGSHTCVELLGAGEEVVIIDNFSNSKPQVLDKTREITGKDFKFYQVDLLDEQGVKRVFDENPDIDSVIHFAALKAVGESVQKPLEYYHNNLTGTLVLCKQMRDHNVKKIVFSSSATVYGSPASLPIRENFPLSTTNPYGSTKLMIEMILKDLCVPDKDWSVALLRYFNPIGAHPSGLIGEEPDGIPNNLLPYVARVACGELECLSVFGDDYDTPDGTGVRDYIHVVDLAKGHLCAINWVRNNKGADAFNLGTGQGYSVLQIVHAFEKYSGRKVNYKIAPRRPGDIAACYADPSKAKEVLGWEAHLGIEEMCRDSWNYIVKSKGLE